MESPSIFSLFIQKVVDNVRLKGKHGVQLRPGMAHILLLLFADDVVLLSTSPTGLQNQTDNISCISKQVGLNTNNKQLKVIVFRKGGRLAMEERWFSEGARFQIVNQYKYLGFVFSTKAAFNAMQEETACRG